MTCRLAALLALALALAGATGAGAQPRGQKAQKAPSGYEMTLQVYLAKGEANACGEGCSEWIAAEGYFDGGAAGRMQAFLKRHGARKLPIYFHSPGGDGVAAMAIGRLLRERGLTAGVGMTIPHACASAADQSPACRAARRSNQAVAAEWRPNGGCNSACVYAVIGGKVRDVPPAARLGVHAAKTTIYRRYSDGRVQQVTAKQDSSLLRNKAAEFDATLRRYLREMGIDGKFFETSVKVPHESIYYLSRDEVAAYGIDRRAFVETPWFIAPSPSNSVHLSKWLVETRGPGRKDYRVSLVFFSCLQARRSMIGYLRGLASDEIGRPVTVTFSIGNHKARFSLTGTGTKQDIIDTGALFASGAGLVPLDELEAAAAQGAIGVVEVDPRADAGQPRAVELSIHGLAEGIKALRDKCMPSAQPGQPVPSWVSGGGQVPFVPAQSGTQNQAVPGMPADRFLLLEGKKKKK